MIRIEPTKKQRNQAKEYIESWMKNFGNVPDCFKADYFNRLFGLMGQIVVSDYLGIGTPENQGPDGGTDIKWNGKTWDIKTEIRNHYFNRMTFVHNLNSKQISNEVEGYIFVNYNKEKGVFEICGWIEKINFFENATHYPEGAIRKRNDGTDMIVQPGGMYELKQKYLMEFK